MPGTADEEQVCAMNDRKRNARSISVGHWWLDTHELTLKHVELYSYWVDAEKLDDAELLDWVKHLSATKCGPLTAQDLRDFVKLARLVQLVDLKKLKAVLRTSNSTVMKAVTKATAEMKQRRKVSRRVKRLMRERGIGPLVTLHTLCELREEAKEQLQ